MLVSTNKFGERSTTTPVAIHLEAAREKLTGDVDFTIDLVICYMRWLQLANAFHLP